MKNKRGWSTYCVGESLPCHLLIFHLLLSDYLEELYPDKAQLYPNDPFQKSKQRMLVETLGSAVGELIFCLYIQCACVGMGF